MPATAKLEIREADLADAGEAAAVVALIDSYARGPGGQSAPLSASARERLVPGLRSHPAALTLMAFADDRPVGLAVCIWGFSTFAGRPFLNVHDLVVAEAERGRGVGRALLDEAERRARERDGCKLTLEVHDTNEGAKRLYRSVGFGPWETPTLYVTKPL